MADVDLDLKITGSAINYSAHRDHVNHSRAASTDRPPMARRAQPSKHTMLERHPSSQLSSRESVLDIMSLVPASGVLDRLQLISYYSNTRQRHTHHENNSLATNHQCTYNLGFLFPY